MPVSPIKRREVIITGVGVRCPESASYDEFKDNLFNGVDMVTSDDRRWPRGLYGLPDRSGKLKDLKGFDASFFNITDEEANLMDPNVRLMCEVTYECIIDAGLDPNSLKGSRTGVFFATFFNETDGAITPNQSEFLAYRQFFSRHINFLFDFQGPSSSYDSACSSSMGALTEANHYLRQGMLDYAIVMSANVALWPGRCLQFLKLGMLSPEGKCNFLDRDGAGYVKSEAVIAVMLQSEVTPIIRSYASLVHARSNTDGYKDEGITFPKASAQLDLLRMTYDEAGIDPQCIHYIEAHGTGTQAGDTQETDSLFKFFRPKPDKDHPLLIGSVKTNMGHGEAASGLCSLIKCLITFETGLIPPNIGLKNINPKITPVLDGYLKPVLTITPFIGEYMGMSSFGFGGSNNHVILKRNIWATSDDYHHGHRVNCSIPRLIYLASRCSDGIHKLESQIKQIHSNDQLTPEFIHLFHSYVRNPRLNHRGYITLDVHGLNQVITSPATSSIVDGIKPPVVFILPGLGGQFNGMGSGLTQLPVYTRSIAESDMIFRKHGYSFDQLIQMEESIVSIGALIAFQIAMIDQLASCGIRPDYYVGYSIGEVVTAYLDGKMTKEQALLAPILLYNRVKERLAETGMEPDGAMAAVGITWEEGISMHEASIYAACDNTSNSITIAGKKEFIAKKMEQLEAQGHFVRDVKCCGLPFHCPEINWILDIVTPDYVSILGNSKQPSVTHKWISTSVPLGETDPYFQATNYLLNNLKSPVLFRDACKRIPTGSVVIEIAPKPFLMSLMKRNITGSLMTITSPSSPFDSFLSVLGICHNQGITPSVSTLVQLEKITLPVPRGTPNLSSLVHWDHSIDRKVRLFPEYFSSYTAMENCVHVDLNTDEWNFVQGHTIDGRILFPATGLLYLGWNCFAKRFGSSAVDFPVTVTSFKINRATICSFEKATKFFVTLLPIESGTSDAYDHFIVTESDVVVASGLIRQGHGDDQLYPPHDLGHDVLMNQEIYKELRIRGYEYKSSFKPLSSTNLSGSQGFTSWTGEWIVYADSLLQLSAIAEPERSLFLPTEIECCHLDMSPLKDLPLGTDIPITYDLNMKRVCGPGVDFYKVDLTYSHRKIKTEDETIESYQFIPYFGENELKYENIMDIFMQIIVENVTEKSVKVSIITGSDEEMTQQFPVTNIMDVTIIVDHFAMSDMMSNKKNEFIIKSDVIYIPIDINGIERNQFLSMIIPMMKKMCFIICHQKIDLISDLIEVSCLNGISLYRKRESSPVKCVDILVENDTFDWVEQMKMVLTSTDQVVRLINHPNDQDINGVIGLMTCLLQEPQYKNRFSCIVNQDDGPSDQNHQFMDSCINNNGLTMNIILNHQLGSYRHLNLRQSSLEVITSSASSLMNIKTIGDLTSLSWFSSDVTSSTSTSSASCGVHVYYSSLNFKDVMLASGKLSLGSIPKEMSDKSCVIGIEFSGIKEATGDRVMGIIPCRGISTHVQVDDPDLLWSIPDSWSLEDASTAPVVYATAFYALIIRGHLCPGESVLIHSGSGGVGQAAIRICLAHGCKVFTSVGSDEKRKYLQRLFPQLEDDHFVNSRDDTFEDHIMTITDGHGVDIVLNSLAEEKLQSSVRCLKPSGRFLEIGKFDLSLNHPIELNLFTENKSFHGIFLDTLFTMDQSGSGHSGHSYPIIKFHKKWLNKLMVSGIESGVVRPLDRTVFRSDDVESAFRFMASGKHLGKVVIQIRDESSSPLINPIPSLRQTHFHGKKSYIIIGGLGGFGLELAQWIVSKGGRYLILTSRSGVTNGYQKWHVKSMERKGAQIQVLKLDASKLDEADQIISSGQSMSPINSIGGMFNLAINLRDNLIHNQTIESFDAASQGKVKGTINLNGLMMGPSFSQSEFICFSSISCGKGLAGQSNYGFANSVMERVCEFRVKHGLKGCAIQWGAIGDVGVLAEKEEVTVRGTQPQRIHCCLQLLDKMMCQSTYPVMACYSPSESKTNEYNNSDAKNVLQKVVHIVGIRDYNLLQGNQNLGELGIDSLMAIEIKQTLERHLEDVGTTFNVQQIRQMTIDDLIKLA